MSAEPIQIIRTKARGVVDSYKFTRARNCNWARSLTNLTAATAQEYEDRFLIELVQNGYDAHAPGTRGGVLHVCFEEGEGSHGTLYVANTGRPFAERNFNAICEIAQSDKPPGVGIGNKGVGFRSVLQVCASPQVYSAAAGGGRKSMFDGFCFGFAEEADYRVLAENDEELSRAMLNDVSPYLLPVPLTGTTRRLDASASEGFASAIRLPLHRDGSRSVVGKQIELLRSSATPILLFLDRIMQLTLEVVRGGGGGSRKTDLIREASPLEGVTWPPDTRCETVTLRRAEDGGPPAVAGVYLVATREVAPERLQAAIRQSIDAGHLDQRFAGWKDEARVSVAVRLDQEDVDCRFYTFLPMEVTSPFAGHLNAPFATKLARTSLNEAMPLNALFLDAAAELCQTAIAALRRAETEVPQNVVLDLLTWRSPYHDRLVAAFTSTGIDIGNVEVIPVVPLADGRKWGRVGRVRRWKEGMTVATPERLASTTGAELVPASVGVARLERLRAFASACGLSLEPDAATAAGWFERIAHDLSRAPFVADTWDGLYHDIATFFTELSRTVPTATEALAGRQLLVDDECGLRKCGPYSADRSGGEPLTAVFFRPTTDRTEDDEEIEQSADVSIPDSLSRHLTYTHRDLAWYKAAGGTLKRTAAREFFQKHGLVLRYDTRSLIEHLSRIVQRSRKENVFADALRLVFNLRKAARSHEALGLERLTFRVPTRHGWTPAADALFSARWRRTLGPYLDELIAETRAASREIQGMERRMLVPPDVVPFSRDESEAWTDFLRALGVKDGLRPMLIAGEPIERCGRELTPRLLGERLGLTDPDLTYWEKANDSAVCKPSHPNGTYLVPAQLVRLPGQADYASFTPRARYLFAVLIAHGLCDWGEHLLGFTIERPIYRNRDPLRWATPLWSFVLHAPWVPMRRPGDRDSEEFVALDRAWHFHGSEGEPPAFAPLMPREIRQVIDGNPTCFRRLVGDDRAAVANRASDAGRLLLYLGQLLARGCIGDGHAPAFRRAYERAWQDLAANACPSPFIRRRPDAFVVVSVRSAIQAVPVVAAPGAGRPDVICVPDAADPLRQQLIHDLGYAVLAVGHRCGAAAGKALGGEMGNRVRLTSSMKVEALADGVPVNTEAGAEPLIVEDTAWVRDLLALTIDLRSRVATHWTEAAQREVQRRLSDLRLKWARRVTLELDGKTIVPPATLDGVVLINDATRPTILVQSEQSRLTWDTLEAISPAVAEAVDRASLASELRLAVIQLRRAMSGDLPAAVSDTEFARALASSVERVASFRRSLRGKASALIYLLRPVAFHYVGREAAEALSAANASSTTEESIVSSLRPYSSALPLPPEDLVHQCMQANDLADLRDRLKIGYGEFNAALRALAPAYRPYHNVSGHADEFAYFKQRARRRISKSLRTHYLPDFREGRSLTAYVERRDLHSLRPDPGWLDLCDRPTESMMEAHTSAWLGEIGAPPLPPSADAMPTVEELHAKNRTDLRVLLSQLAKIVLAWCRKNGRAAPPAWNGPDAAAGLLDQMHAAGVLDFALLAEADVLKWLISAGQWPSGMPATCSVPGLGLTDLDLEGGISATETERRRIEYEAKTIEVGGKRYSIGDEERAGLISAVRESISTDFLESPKTIAGLEAMEASTATPGRGRGRRGKGRSGRMTEAQKELIGLVGEVLAFEWLKCKFDHVDENCWKSGYRNLIFGGAAGEDECGFDFQVFERNQPIMFEVKSTTGEDCVIELGPSEVRAAQKAARTNKYRILFVRNVLDTDSRAIFVLPNPFSDGGRDLFRTVGTGLKFAFQFVP